jgi:amidase
VELTAISAVDLVAMIARRELGCAEVMAAYLARISLVNPVLNAVVSLRDSDALMDEARAADSARAPGPLHGLPLAVKDLVATKGLRTTYGSPVFADYVPVKDDLLAARMRTAGAIFIGKTNTPEWGHGSHSFNPVHGVTRNPYDLTRTAGGSSGGAAAGLAARILPVADGSDMMGSLRNPAAFCNVYGFRPTWGVVPGDAVGDTFMATLATEGPMARDIADLALLLDVQAGENPAVPFGRTGRFETPVAADMRGKKIAWLGDWGRAYQMEPGILAQSEAALRVFETLGAEIVPLARHKRCHV